MDAADHSHPDLLCCPLGKNPSSLHFYVYGPRHCDSGVLLIHRNHNAEFLLVCMGGDLLGRQLCHGPSSLHTFADRGWQASQAQGQGGAEGWRGEGRIRWKDFGLVMTLFCIGYVPYMAAVDVPSYWKDHQTQQLQSFVPNSFAEGVWNALTFRDVTHNLSLWQPSLLWKSLYFTLGPWLSMAMMTAPVVEVDEVGKPSECTSSVDVDV